MNKLDASVIIHFKTQPFSFINPFIICRLIKLKAHALSMSFARVCSALNCYSD